MSGFELQSEGDLIAVIVSETYELLSDIFGPYSFRVSGEKGDQQAVFRSEAEHMLFYVRIHEFVARAPGVYAAGRDRRPLSLMDGGLLLIERYPDDADACGLNKAYEQLSEWINREVRVRFWSGSLWRHLTFTEPFVTLLAPQAHFSKHTLLKLGREVQRLRSMCERSSCPISLEEAVAAKEEYAAHLDGMMQYHATELAEYTGRYFLALYWFVRGRFNRNPTNNLDAIEPPRGVTSDVFRYLYASAVVSFSRWTEQRILEYIPETSRSFKPPYPQHEAADPRA